jgi:glycine/sarcosine N-methyltransferase
MYFNLSEFYDQLFPQDPALKGFIKGFIKGDALAIDLGSGTGRMTKLISELGMKVIGVDLDEGMVKIAKAKYPELEFRVSDMVEVLKEDKQYELITCFGNTLVHLNKNQLMSFFKEVQKKLSPKGYLIAQVLNYTKILREKPKELKELRSSDIVLNRFYDYHKDYILFTTKLSLNDKESIGSTEIYPYTYEEFTSLFKTLGLKYQYLGDLKLKPFQESDYYLYMIITQS